MLGRQVIDELALPPGEWENKRSPHIPIYVDMGTTGGDHGLLIRPVRGHWPAHSHLRVRVAIVTLDFSPESEMTK